MADSELQALLAELDDPSNLSWRDETYSIDRVSELDTAERSLYVRRLIGLAEHGDEKAMLSLGALKVPEAVDPLLRYSKANGTRASYARRALVWLGHGQAVIDDIAKDALTSPAMSVRAAAVLNLGELGGPVAIDALDKCLDDSDSVVRAMAADGLIKLFHIERFTRDVDGQTDLTTPLERMKLVLSSEIPALASVGANELRTVIHALRQGGMPETVGLQLVKTMPEALSDRIGPALADETTTLPVEEIAAVSGQQRQWAEAILAFGLERQDARIPPALAQLDARWTLPALDSLAETSDPGDFRDAVEAARRALSSPPN